MLDVNNDKDILRNKLSVNITTKDLTSLIQQSLNKFAINLPLDDTYTISNVKHISSHITDGIDKDQISFDHTTSAYNQEVLSTANTIIFSNVTIWGFESSVKNDNTWWIVGLSLGGAALIGIIVTIVLLWRRHNRNHY